MSAHHHTHSKRRPGRTLRLFVCCDPPLDVARSLIDLADDDTVPGHPTDPAKLHLTLLFLGDVDERQLDETIVSVERAASGIPPFALTPERLITLPDHSRTPPRLLAVTTDAPCALVELQSRLSHRLARPNQRQRGRFLPHLTIKRFDHGERAGAIDRPVDFPPFAIDRVRLVSSTLRPTGAQHVTVREVPLR